jgi:hypothetical protein
VQVATKIYNLISLKPLWSQLWAQLYCDHALTSWTRSTCKHIREVRQLLLPRDVWEIVDSWCFFFKQKIALSSLSWSTLIKTFSTRQWTNFGMKNLSIILTAHVFVEKLKNLEFNFEPVFVKSLEHLSIRFSRIKRICSCVYVCVCVCV